jgi:hypothetical protein
MSETPEEERSYLVGRPKHLQLDPKAFLEHPVAAPRAAATGVVALVHGIRGLQ